MDSNCSTRGQLLNPSPPLPSPSWAERVRGVANRGETRAKPPVNNSTPTHTIFSSTPTGAGASSLPSAHSQFLARENCRRRGVPARLVLDTDGVTEEVSLWFRAGANVGGSTAASHAAAAHVVSGKRRRERARRRRRREERRREERQRRICCHLARKQLAETRRRRILHLPRQENLLPLSFQRYVPAATRPSR